MRRKARVREKFSERKASEFSLCRLRFRLPHRRAFRFLSNRHFCVVAFSVSSFFIYILTRFLLPRIELNLDSTARFLFHFFSLLETDFCWKKVLHLQFRGPTVAVFGKVGRGTQRGRFVGVGERKLTLCSRGIGEADHRKIWPQTKLMFFGRSGVSHFLWTLRFVYICLFGLPFGFCCCCWTSVRGRKFRVNIASLTFPFSGAIYHERRRSSKYVESEGSGRVRHGQV